MIKLITFLLLLMTLQQTYCQYHIISGYVEDENTGERVIGAYVADSITKTQTQTNGFGFFKLTIMGDNVALRSTFIGLKSKAYLLHIEHDTLINILMQTETVLKEVIVTASLYKHNVNAPLGFISIPLKGLTSIPALGESDLVKSIQNQPGIKGGVEGSTGLFVRGGSAGENLLMLDDVPIYNISHLYGFFSTFNSSAIKDVKLYKGSFPAKYGGRASSVIDVRTLDGNNKSIKGEISLGFISSKFTIEGPLVSPNTTFIISGRRSYFDLYSGTLKTLNLLDLNFPGYYFYDLNIRLTHTFSQKDKLFLSLYKGKDKIKYKNNSYLTNSEIESFSDFTNETSGWGNIIGSLRWNHTFKNYLFVNTTLAYSSYDCFIQSYYNSTQSDSVHNETLYENYSASYRSDILNLIIKTDFDFSLSNSHKLAFGFGNEFHVYNPGGNIYSMINTELNLKTDTSFSNKKLNDNQPFFYFEDEIIVTQKLLVRSGLRLSGLISKNKLSINPEPRLSANFAILSRLAIKVGYSRMVQYMHLLSTSGLSMPTDIWVPALNGLHPLKSDQLNCGIAYAWNQVALVSVELYRKWFNHTTDFRNGSSLLSESSPWYDKTTQGHGNAKGIEVSVEKQDGQFTGSINYTYSKADRNYSELNNGKTFPFKYDRLHDLNISLNYKFEKKWDISVLWCFGSGFPVTTPVEKYYPALNIVSGLQHNQIYYYPSLNNYRLPAYHRLDLGVHYRTQNRFGEQLLSFDVFNVYNRKNPINMYFLQNYSFKYVYLFPIIPSVTYTLKFK